MDCNFPLFMLNIEDSTIFDKKNLNIKEIRTLQCFSDPQRFVLYFN